MKLYSIEGNRQRLDGGAMFGNAPKELWKRWVEVDDKNRIHLACRALLLQTDDGKNILFETGIGVAYPEKFKERFGIFETENQLLKNLQAQHISPEQIDAVVLSHLHFDHAGGLLKFNQNAELELAFPNAQIYVGKDHWQRATNPHPRDRASFLPELHALLKNSGRLHLIAGPTHPDFSNLVTFRFSEGHTPGLMHAEIAHPKGRIVFASDLIPGMPWIHLPITMGYDRFPERLIEEKEKLLTEISTKDGYLFLTHDKNTACARVEKDEKGKFFGVAAPEILN